MVSGMLGQAIWPYRKPIYTAVVVEKRFPSTESFDGDASTASSSSANSSELPPLISAQLFSSGDETGSEVSASGRSNQSFDVEDQEQTADEWLLASIYKYSIIFGLLVGCFIQSSSLGANYILMIVFGRDFEVMAQHHQNVVLFSLAWSFLTSLMGIAILLILRSLISLASQGLDKSNLPTGPRTIFFSHQLSLVAYLEFPFAFGALAGVCASWAGTDLLLGLESHAYHSLLTLFMAYFGKFVFESCSRRSVIGSGCGERDEPASDKTQPLLESRESAEEKVQRIHKEFKSKGLITGLLVGFFIQFSSLGASFLIDALANDDETDENHQSSISKQNLLLFSLGWSFVFGTMGVAILLLLRYLVGIVCDHILSQSQSPESEIEEEEEMADKWSVSLEFFFAVGCLVGVNMAWLLTDVGLGLNAHIWRSILTLGAAGVWCCVLARCFGFRHVVSSEDTNSNVIYPTSKKTVTKATQTNSDCLLIV